MPLSWNEIRSRALEFSKRWEHESSENAEAKLFWIEFLNVFGIDRKRVASFEEPVKKLGDKQGYIDLFSLVQYEMSLKVARISTMK